jgi:hypothetical protein
MSFHHLRTTNSKTSPEFAILTSALPILQGTWRQGPHCFHSGSLARNILYPARRHGCERGCICGGTRRQFVGSEPSTKRQKVQGSKPTAGVATVTQLLSFNNMLWWKMNNSFFYFGGPYAQEVLQLAIANYSDRMTRFGEGFLRSFCFCFLRNILVAIFCWERQHLVGIFNVHTW